jgi:anti-sigma factor RsiW
MQCVEFEDRLNAVLDERSFPEWSAELRSHYESCASCRQLAAAYGALFDGFYALATPEPPADLTARVMAELKPQPAPRVRHRALWAAALTTAAALFVAVLPLVDQWRQPKPPVAAAPLPQASLAELAKLLRNLPLPIFAALPVMFSPNDEEAYAELAKRTGRGLARLVLASPRFGGQPDVASDNDEFGLGDEPAWAVIGDEFRPVTDPVSEGVAEALNLLLKALPVTELASR